ncbi:MAG: hypothetical protein A3F17_00270 [Gammaproteobacteria bacterium RIFCSPHIGHO2_12_FULL_41_15]|nr:MAG: hypothetical protein A3F17_00270 [Gammaproteobacteria bacterium RIFCSPHIGHO2_12_FULL_41_15]
MRQLNIDDIKQAAEKNNVVFAGYQHQKIDMSEVAVEIFHQQDHYSGVLNQEILNYNEYNYKRTIYFSARVSYLAMQLRTLLKIYDLVNQHNAGQDAEFITRYYQAFNQQKQILLIFYHQQIQLGKENPSITKLLIELEKCEMRPPPPPAPDIDPPTAINPDEIEEGSTAKKWRYASYTLFGASILTGVAGGGTVAVGANALKKAAEEAAKQAAKKTIVVGSIVVATSVATGSGGMYASHKATIAANKP